MHDLLFASSIQVDSGFRSFPISPQETSCDNYLFKKNKSCYSRLENFILGLSHRQHMYIF